MKTLFSLLLVTIPFISFGKNAPGYIVTLEYDTVQVEIIGASGLLVESYFEQVRVKDAAGAVKVYTPEDLVAFGYKQKNWPMIYRSKPIENGKKRFLFLDKGGASSSLYYFGRADRSLGLNETLMYYTLENASGEYIFVTNFEKISSVKTKLTSFYQHHPEALKFIASSFKGKGKIDDDIKALVKLANK